MEPPDILRFIFALIFVIALIIGLTIILRKFNGFSFPNLKGGKRRLGIVEILPIDTRRKLVLLKKDEREFLVLIGGTTDLVVEALDAKD